MGTRIIRTGTRMVQVRRRRPVRIFWTTVLLVLTLIIYVVFAMPAITEKKQAVDANAQVGAQADVQEGPRVT